MQPREPDNHGSASKAETLVRAVRDARSERSYRRKIKNLRDEAVRAVRTDRLGAGEPVPGTDLLEYGDGSIATVRNVNVKGRRHHAKVITNPDDRGMARKILHQQEDGEPPHHGGCCVNVNGNEHCHDMLPAGSTCWVCFDAYHPTEVEDNPEGDRKGTETGKEITGRAK